MNMTECEEFFTSPVTVFVGERDCAEKTATKVAARLMGAGVAFEKVPCLQHEDVQLYSWYQGALCTEPNELSLYLDFVDRKRMRNPTAPRHGICPTRMAPTRGRINLRDQAHAVDALTPLVGRRMRLATADGRLAFGGWWLGSLGADTFEVEGGFEMSRDRDQFRKQPCTHIILEVWPTGNDGARLNCVRGGPHTTMIHVPFGHDIALHLVDDNGAADTRNRMDENLRGVFG